MRIDFRDPDIPFSHPLPDNFPINFSPDISPSNIPIFSRERG